MTVEIILDTHLRILESDLDPDWVDPLVDKVSIPNEAKEIAEREHIWGAKKLPDTIPLCYREEGYLVLPRGYYKEFNERLNGFGIGTRLQDNRRVNDARIDSSRQVDLRDYQHDASKSIIENEQGIVNIPPGGGKTVIGLDAIKKAQQKTLVITDKVNIADQWRERADEHFGIETGMIGDSIWEEKPLTVAILQTLNSREESLDEKAWWDDFGFILLDEQHHSAAETYFNIVSKFAAKYRIGVSATVGKTPSKAKKSKLLFGPVFFEDEGKALEPTIHKIPTDFEFEYHPTEVYKDDKGKKRVKRNNYTKLIKELVGDGDRNTLIARRICSEPNEAHLVISRRLKQLDAIGNLCGQYGFDPDAIYFLTGNESLEQRKEVYAKADKGGCVVLSTIADEALDIPRLDRIHLAFPQKNFETIKQQIGRGSRFHDNKSGFLVLDYVDSIDVIQNQYKHRMFKLYKPQKWRIVNE